MGHYKSESANMLRERSYNETVFYQVEKFEHYSRLFMALEKDKQEEIWTSNQPAEGKFTLIL